MKIKEVRNYFPQIKNNPQDTYLDSASTTLKLQVAIDRLHQFYNYEVSNVHRGSHSLSAQSTKNYEQSRETVAQFLSARHPEEIVFVRNTTEGLNFLASILASKLQKGDEVLVTEMEHHSNLLPWIILSKKYGFKVRSLPVTPLGELDLSNLNHFLNSKTKIFSFVHQSNAIGTVNPAAQLIQKAREVGAITILDAAQSVSAIQTDVQKLNCDFLVFSGHKLFSPSGIGVIYGKEERWKSMEPYQSGGGMVIDSIKQIWTEPPHRFEAGTPFIEGALALSASLKFLMKNVSFKEVQEHEKHLLTECEMRLKKISELKIIGNSPTRINTLSFIIKNFHSDDVGHIMSAQKVAVRSGHHCCQPLMDRYHLTSGTVRVSFSIYNQEKDIDHLEKSIQKTISILKQ